MHSYLIRILIATTFAQFFALCPAIAAAKKPLKAVLSLGDGYDKFEFQTATHFGKISDITPKALNKISKIEDLQKFAVKNNVFDKPADFYTCVTNGIKNGHSDLRPVSAEAYSGMCAILGTTRLSGGQGTMFVYGRKSPTNPKLAQDTLVVMGGEQRFLMEAAINELKKTFKVSNDGIQQLDINQFCSMSNNFISEKCRELAASKVKPSKCISLPGGENPIDSSIAQPSAPVENSDSVDPRANLISINGFNAQQRLLVRYDRRADQYSIDRADCVKCPAPSKARDNICRDTDGCDALREKIQGDGKCDDKEYCKSGNHFNPNDCGEKGCQQICKMISENMKIATSRLANASFDFLSMNLDNDGLNIFFPSSVMVPLRKKPEFQSLISRLEFESQSISSQLNAKPSVCNEKNCRLAASQLEDTIQSLVQKSCDGIWGTAREGKEKTKCYPKVCARCVAGFSNIREPISIQRFARIGSCTNFEMNDYLNMLHFQTSNEAHSRAAICATNLQPEICEVDFTVSQNDLTQFMQSLGVPCAQGTSTPQQKSSKKAADGT